jgi:hypothetical protein
VGDDLERADRLDGVGDRRPGTKEDARGDDARREQDESDGDEDFRGSGSYSRIGMTT